MQSRPPMRRITDCWAILLLLLTVFAIEQFAISFIRALE